MFPRRGEMAPGYFDYGRSLETSDPARAAAVLERALRIDPDGPHARSIESELRLLEALGLERRGIVDEASFERAATLDPKNTRARDEWARVRSSQFSLSKRVVAAVAATIVAAVGAAGLAALVRRTRTRA